VFSNLYIMSACLMNNPGGGNRGAGLAPRRRRQIRPPPLRRPRRPLRQPTEREARGIEGKAEEDRAPAGAQEVSATYRPPRPPPGRPIRKIHRSSSICP
jgi:hypothetical protein